MTFYYESAPILYGTTSFYFDDAQRLRAFLGTVSDRNLACITTLHVQVRTYGIPNEIKAPAGSRSTSSAGPRSMS